MVSQATHEQKKRKCNLERESWLVAWCPGTQAYISATTPRDCVTLYLGGVEALGSALRSFTSNATNKWRCTCEHVRESPQEHQRL